MATKKPVQVIESTATVTKPAVSPLVAGAQSTATSGGVLVARREFECRRCHCRGQNPLACGVCKSRNCMDEVFTISGAGVGAPGQPTDPAAVTAAEVKARGKLSSAIASGAKILRRRSGIPKFDRVLGGGYVDKTAILIAGDPGAGKSTLLLQACVAFAGPVKYNKTEQAAREKVKDPVEREALYPEVHRALYVSGEEAFEQVGARAGRIPGAVEKGEYIEFVSTRNVPELMGAILDVRPHLVVCDSIQEVGDEALSGRFGGENQVANAIRSTMKCVREVGFGTAVFVCHVRKDGDLAGAKKGEHLVDAVMKLSIALRDAEDEEEEDLPEDEKTVHDERYLEAFKNRYGAITERAVFTMTAQGLR